MFKCENPPLALTPVDASELASLAAGDTAWLPITFGPADIPEDCLLMLLVKTGTGTSGSGSVGLTLSGSIDGTTFTSVVADLPSLGSITCGADSTTYSASCLALAQTFGGILPPYMKVGVTNNTGADLAASGHSAQYTAVRHH